MSERITPPWSLIQIEALNAYQRSGRFHPFTCGGDRGDHAHRRYAAESGDGDLGLLIAKSDGWHCPACGYRQAWAHSGMAVPELAPPVTAADRLVRTDIAVSRAQLGEILGLDEDDDPPGPIIGVCAGEWRREAADLWRAWDHDEDNSSSSSTGPVETAEAPVAETPATPPAGADRSELREALARVIEPGSFAAEAAAESVLAAARWRQRQQAAYEIADALLAGPLATLIAERDAARAERDEARAAEHPTNDTLDWIGACRRKVKIGKHQATNWVHLRATVAALDAADQHEAADTLIWQVWHRVNSAVRHDEFYGLALNDKTEAVARATAAETALNEARERIGRLEAALEPFALDIPANVPGDATASLRWPDYPGPFERRVLTLGDVWWTAAQVRRARVTLNLETDHADA